MAEVVDALHALLQAIGNCDASFDPLRLLVERSKRASPAHGQHLDGIALPKKAFNNMRAEEAHAQIEAAEAVEHGVRRDMDEERIGGKLR